MKRTALALAAGLLAAAALTGCSDDTDPCDEPTTTPVAAQLLAKSTKRTPPVRTKKTPAPKNTKSKKPKHHDHDDCDD
jgi:hypothetical protein